MRALIASLLLACGSVCATPPHPALDKTMETISVKAATCADSLEFLRYKGTEILRANTGNQYAILIFEYRFNIKARKLGTYSGKKVKFAEALRETLSQFGLAYEIVSNDRIAIVDDESQQGDE